MFIWWYGGGGGVNDDDGRNGGGGGGGDDYSYIYRWMEAEDNDNRFFLEHFNQIMCNLFSLIFNFSCLGSCISC